MQKVEYKMKDILKATCPNIIAYLVVISPSIYIFANLEPDIASFLVLLIFSMPFILFGGHNLGKILIDFALCDVYKIEGNCCISVIDSHSYLGISSTTVYISDPGDEEKVTFDVSGGLWDFRCNQYNKVTIYFTKRSKIIVGGKNIKKK